MLIESFHTGRHGRRQYCSLHRPATRLVRSTGVVLCYPLGHEYYRSHRTYVKLADQLARLGFPVMRFDYIGSGDSDGDIGHARLEDWLNDVIVSVNELKRSEAVSSIALGGMRFGATLSMLAAQRIDATCMLLWDAVDDGPRYLDELKALHLRMLQDLERFPRRRHETECEEGEFIGCRYQHALLQDISSIHFGALPSIDTAKVIAVNTRGQRSVAGVSESEPDPRRLLSLDVVRDYGWLDVHRLTETIVDPDTVRQVAASMNAIAA